MTKLVIQDNKYCQFITDDKQIFNSLRNFLSYKMTGVEYTEAYQNGWSGITYLMSKRGVFYSGLLPKVRQFLIDKTIIFSEEDKRSPIIVAPSLDLSDKLKQLKLVPRDYQERTINIACSNEKGI